MVDGTQTSTPQIQDGVDNQLARTMKGHVAAPVRHDQVSAPRTEGVAAQQHVVIPATGPHRVYRRVLE